MSPFRRGGVLVGDAAGRHGASLRGEDGRKNRALSRTEESLSGNRAGMVRHVRRCRCGAVLVNSEIDNHACRYTQAASSLTTKGQRPAPARISVAPALSVTSTRQEAAPAVVNKSQLRLLTTRTASNEGECPICRRGLPLNVIGKHLAECAAREDRVGRRMEQNPGPLFTSPKVDQARARRDSVVQPSQRGGRAHSNLPVYAARSDTGLGTSGFRAPRSKGEKLRRPEIY